MPIPVPILAAGANLVGQLGNAASTILTNRSSQKFQSRMYDRQRADALSDWEMQNQYNSPEAQMARFKAAGLNPHLIYGQGAGNANAGPVRSSQPGQWKPDAPQFDPGSVLGTYMNTKIQGLQTEIMAKQAEDVAEAIKLKQTQQLLNLAGIKVKDMDTATKEFKLGLEKSLVDTTAALRRGAVDQQQANIQFTLDENTRKALKNKQEISESVARIVSMKIGNKLTEQNIKKAAAETEKILYERYGIMPSIAAQIAHQAEKSLIDAGKMPGGNQGNSENILQTLIKGAMDLIF